MSLITRQGTSGPTANFVQEARNRTFEAIGHRHIEWEAAKPGVPAFDQQVDLTLQRAMAELSVRLPDAERKIEEFLSYFGQPPIGAGFKHIAPGARALHAEVSSTRGAATASQFLLVSLLAAVRASLRDERLARLPARVQVHQMRQFVRIASHNESFLEYCQLDGDVFLKEFGLATLRLYAGASSVIDPYSGLGRSLISKGGIRQLAGRALFFASVGGFRPYFEIHVHKLYLDEFNEEGRNECYRCCAELYALHPDNLGMFAGSWFYDPAVAKISPHLSYLRDVPVTGGARCLFVSYSEQALANATATSSTRRALHAAGRYRPASYLIVWPRRAQIAWASPNRAAAGQVESSKSLIVQVGEQLGLSRLVRMLVPGKIRRDPVAIRPKLTAKTFFLHIAKYAGLFALMRMLTGDSPRILCYHAGSIGDERHYNPKLFCTREQLRQRLDWLRSHGFTPADLNDVMHPRKPSISGIPVAITLDDGWYSTYRDLLPSLAEYGYRPVLYLHTEAYDIGVPVIPVTVRYLLWKAGAQKVVLDGFGFGIGGTWNLANPQERARLCSIAEQWLNEQDPHSIPGSLKRFAALLGISAAQLDLESRRFSYMTHDELTRACASGCHIELHGHEHIYRPGRPRRNIENIEMNRERICELGLPFPTHYCYPSGSFDGYAPEVMRAARVASATTCVPGLVNLRDPDVRYYLPRFLDGGNVSMIEFEAEMSGVMQLLRKFARRTRQPREVLRSSTA